MGIGYIVDNECSNISNTDVAINNGGMDCVVSGNDVRDGGLTTVEWVFPREIDALICKLWCGINRRRCKMRGFYLTNGEVQFLK